MFVVLFQTRKMNEAEKTVEDVKRIQRLLKAETGLHMIASADNQVKGQYNHRILGYSAKTD